MDQQTLATAFRHFIHGTKTTSGDLMYALVPRHGERASTFVLTEMPFVDAKAVTRAWKVTVEAL